MVSMGHCRVSMGLLLSLAISGWLAGGGWAQSASWRTGSFEALDQPLTEVITQVARAMGMRVQIAPDLDEVLVTFSLRGVTPEQVLQLLSETYRFSVIRAGGDLLRIEPLRPAGREPVEEAGPPVEQTEGAQMESYGFAPPPTASIFGSEEAHQRRLAEDAASASEWGVADLMAAQALAMGGPVAIGSLPGMASVASPLIPLSNYGWSVPDYHLSSPRARLHALGYLSYGAGGLGPGFIGPLRDHSRPLLGYRFAPLTVLPPSWPMYPYAFY